LGIGLALVKRLVELHQGTVSAESEGPGRGSRLTVELPAAEAAPAQQPGGGNSDQASALHASLNVLIVDDNHDGADMLGMLVEALGHRPVVVNHPAAALEFAQQGQVDVCLLDIGLPDIDGYKLARRLREMATTRSATMVAVTGYGQEHDKGRSAAAGFDHHMVKPVQAEVLARMLSGNH
jgi:CheY-like chemotaxis protein